MNYSFEDLGLNEKILNQIKKLGYENPTEIQYEAIPFILEGKDILGQAQTGTGKTAAFALPILSKLEENGSIAKKNCPDVLVLAPTRELAIQVAESFESFSQQLKGISVISIYGGQDYTKQIRGLKYGVNIVVGTTGRVMDHMERGTLDLSNLKYLVLDEADEMLRMGFIDDVKFILSHTNDNCQRILFSATMPSDIMHIVNSYLRNPAKIQIRSKTNTASSINQKYLIVRGLKKIEALDRILSCEKTDGIIIFVKTKSETVEISSMLKDFGYNCGSMSGDMSQSQRELIIDYLKSGKIKILVATDVVARGLDVDCISHVINWELPTDHEAYIHRIGRTGRAGRSGEAISLIYPKELRLLKSIEKTIKAQIEEIELPSSNIITNRRISDLEEKIEKIIENEDLSKFSEILDKFIKEKNLDINEISKALLFLAQKEKPFFVKDITINNREDRPFYDFESGKKNRFENNFENKFSKRNFKDDMINYKINLGENNEIENKHIFGAFANEGNLSKEMIGQIKIYKNHSFIKLSKNLSNSEIEKLKKIRIMGNKIILEKDTDFYKN
jgi:ATP-dependent RNA helicase DeaD